MGLKYFSFFLVLIFAISFTSALNFERDSEVILKVPCQFNGTNCDDTAICNISIKYPNETLMINNSLMINNGNGLPAIALTDSSIVGDYIGNMVCTQEGVSGGDVFPFTISVSGTSLTTGQGILYFLFLISALIATSVSMFWAIRLPFKNIRDEEGVMINVNDLKYLKIFLSVITYVMIMWIFGIMRGISNNFLILQGPRLFFEWGYWIMLSFMWPIIVLSFLFALLLLLGDKKILKALERGTPLNTRGIR